MKSWRVIWAGLLALAGYISSHVLGFLPAPPPALSDEANGFWFGAGIFLTCGIIALIEFLARVFAGKNCRWQWFCAAFISLILATFAFSQYHKKYETWTIAVWDKR